MDTPGRDPEIDLTGFESRLALLRPAAIAIARDRLLFEAGRASARLERRGRLGPAMAALFGLVAVGLVGLLVRERQERRSLEVMLAAKPAEVAPLAPDPPQPVRPIEPDSYLALTRHFQAGGLDSSPSRVDEGPSKLLPERPMPPSSPLRVRGPGGLIDL